MQQLCHTLAKHMCCRCLPLCRCVEREYDGSRDMFTVAGVAEEQRTETAAGDLLFLKGQAYPGLFGEEHLVITCYNFVTTKLTRMVWML